MLQANDVNTRGEQPSGSWPERVIEILRRIFIPEPQPVLVPVVARPAGPVRRRS